MDCGQHNCGTRAVHKVRKHKRGNGLVIIKLDMKKAYDHLEWDFVIKPLEAWGFGSNFGKLVLSCLDYVEFSIPFNGSPRSCKEA